MTNYVIVFTTTEKKADAEKIADTLVSKKLAGCVQIIGPINSVYRWKGNVEKSEEFLCLIKTSAKLFKSVEQAIKEIHPYQVPEIISARISAGSDEYLSWLGNILRASK